MKHRFGLFDVDCQELNEACNGLSLRPRVEPLAEALGRLYAWAEKRGFPVVFTTCCSGRMPGPGDLKKTVYVPIDPASREWEQCVDDCRIFYLQKNAYGDPKINSRLRAYDMFQDNGNAQRLARRLDVERWLVFGNAFDTCVACAARGLLAAARRCAYCPTWECSAPRATDRAERRRTCVT